MPSAQEAQFIQIGITLAGYLASAAAAVSLARPLIGPLGFLGSAAEPVAIVLVTIVLTFFTLVVGELQILNGRVDRCLVGVAA